jgi:hypothetical protein
MLNKKVLFIFFLVIFVLTSYLLLSNNSKFYSSEEIESFKPDLESYSVVIEKSDDLGGAGIALLSGNESKTNINIKLVGFDNTKEFAASINNGSCDNSGSKLFGLNTINNNQSITDVDIIFTDLRQNSSLSLSIKDKDSNDILACADLNK